MTAQPCPDCGHDIDSKHTEGAGCSEPVPGPHGLTFCKCPHDARTARRLAAGERLAVLASVLLIQGYLSDEELMSEFKECANICYNRHDAP